MYDGQVPVIQVRFEGTADYSMLYTRVSVLDCLYPCTQYRHRHIHESTDLYYSYPKSGCRG